MANLNGIAPGQKKGWFKPGEVHNPLGRGAARPSGRVVSLKLLDQVLAELADDEAFKLKLQDDIRRFPFKWYRDVIVPMCIRSVSLELGEQAGKRWISILAGAIDPAVEKQVTEEALNHMLPPTPPAKKEGG